MRRIGWMALALVLILAGAVPVLQAQQDGVSCADFPQYCVTLAGQVEGSTLAGVEGPGTRALDGISPAAVSVIRGVDQFNLPVLGDPAAPVDLLLVIDPADPASAVYFMNEFQQYLVDYVLPGEGTARLVLIDSTAEIPDPSLAAQGALCAGEQGGLWELVEKLSRQSAGAAAVFPFGKGALTAAAGSTGLDTAAFGACLDEARYVDTAMGYAALARGLRLDGFPAVFLRPGQDTAWLPVDSRYDLVAGTAEALRSLSAPPEPVVIEQQVTCADYPQYCVPLAGGLDGFNPLANHAESDRVRTLDGESSAVPGVVRGVREDGSLFLGDPAAPVQFMLFFNFTCGHCLGYHQEDLVRVIPDFVLTGQANLRVQIMAFGAQPYSDNSAMSALCAAEQGAFWEFQETLYHLTGSMRYDQAFDAATLREAATQMGLDGDALVACIDSRRYAALLGQYLEQATALGITGTPSMMVRYGDDGVWEKTVRRYGNLAQLIEAATASP